MIKCFTLFFKCLFVCFLTLFFKVGFLYANYNIENCYATTDLQKYAQYVWSSEYQVDSKLLPLNCFNESVGNSVDFSALQAFYYGLQGNGGLTITDISSLDNVTLGDRGGECRIVELKFPNKGFSGQIPEKLVQLVWLEHIDFSGNEFNKLPEGIEKLENLKHIDISNNKLTTLPEEIGLLEELEYMDFSNNALSVLPKEIGMLQDLEYMDFSNTGLTILPEEMANLNKLQHLAINDNKLTTISDSFSQLSNINTLLLQGNEIKTLPDGIVKLKHIIHLDLSHNELTTLPGMIGDWTQLKKLYLNDNKLTSLPNAINNWTKLEMLHLNGNKLASLPNEIDNWTKLERLYLNDNELSSIPSMEKLDALEILYLQDNELTNVSNKAVLNNLHTLNLNNNKLSDYPFKTNNGEGKELRTLYFDRQNGNLTQFPEELEDMRKLEYLSMKENDLTGNPELDLDDLREVYLDANKFNSFPKKVLEASNLEILSLNDNMIGSIPQAIKDGKALKELYLNRNNVGSIHERIDALTELIRLEINDNNLTEIPEGIGETSLQYLYANGNNLTALPNSIKNLTNLKELLLHKNQIEELPNGVESWTQLEKLYLHENEVLRILPNGMGTWAKMNELLLHNNQLLSIPSGVGELDNLSILTLHNNSLTTLPPGIGNLDQLTELSVYNNQLESIPTTIGSLINLTKLELHINNITQIPESIADLTNLEILTLNDNELSKLPSNIGFLTKLTQFPIHHNKIIELPSGIGNMTELTRWEAQYNQIEALPATIGQLTKLTYFNVDSNDIGGVLPENMSDLSQLDTLILSRNKIEGLPTGIGNLIELRHFPLFHNQLLSLPPSIGNLEKLEEWMLYDNQLEELPTSITELTGLKKLHLHENRLGSLPEDIGDLSNLEEFPLYRNQLVSLPKSIEFLQKLTEWMLYENHLQTLPVEIGELKNLTFLNFNNNRLEYLPTTIGNLENIEKLFLNENCFEDRCLDILPSQIGNLGKLKILQAEKNHLSGLPGTFKDLDALEELYFNNNYFEELSVGIMDLEKLRILNMSYNKLKNVTTNSTELKELEDLNLRYNQLEVLPKELGGLINLKKLDIGNNKIESLIKLDSTNILYQMHNLVELKLDSNKIGVFPIDNGDFEKLEILHLNNNRIGMDKPNGKDVNDFENLHTLASIKEILVQDNYLTFTDLEENVEMLKDELNCDSSPCFCYAPQAKLQLDPSVEDGALVLGAGGRLVDNEYWWYSKEDTIEALVNGIGEEYSRFKSQVGTFCAKATNKTVTNPDVPCQNLVLKSEFSSVECSGDMIPIVSITQICSEDNNEPMISIVPPPEHSTYSLLINGENKGELEGEQNFPLEEVSIVEFTSAVNNCKADPVELTPVSCNCITEDSLALIAIYQAMGGDAWIDSWNIENNIGFVKDWKGVELEETGCRVIGLDLSAQGLTGDLSAEIGSLTELKRLNLGENPQIGKIANEISHCTQLEYLALNGIGLQDISFDISAFTELTTLYLQTNQLQDLSAITSPLPPNLQEVFIQDNSLTFDGIKPLWDDFEVSLSENCQEMPCFHYAPQATIPIHEDTIDNKYYLYVLPNDDRTELIYDWYEVGNEEVIYSSSGIDSLFQPSKSGSYYAIVSHASITDTNYTQTELRLRSETLEVSIEGCFFFKPTFDVVKTCPDEDGKVMIEVIPHNSSDIYIVSVNENPLDTGVYQFIMNELQINNITIAASSNDCTSEVQSVGVFSDVHLRIMETSCPVLEEDVYYTTLDIETINVWNNEPYPSIVHIEDVASGEIIQTTDLEEGKGEVVVPTGSYTIFADTDKCRTIPQTIHIEIPNTQIEITEESGLNSNDGIICPEDKVVLSTDGYVDYLWSTGNTESIIEVTPVETTIYSVTLTNTQGCEVIANQIIEVNPSNDFCETDPDTEVRFPGNLPTTKQFVCVGELIGGATPILSEGVKLGQTDILNYIFHTENIISTGTVGNILGRRINNANFAFDELENVAYNTTYYVSVVIGPNTQGNGAVDLEDASSLISLGFEAVFLEQIQIQTQILCQDNDSFSVEVQATGGMPSYDESKTYNLLPSNELLGVGESIFLEDLVSGEVKEIQVTDDEGCLATETVEIYELEVFMGSEEVSNTTITIQEGESINLLAWITETSDVTYSWLPNIGIDNINTPNVNIAPLETTTYTVTASIEDGTCELSREVTIEVVSNLPCENLTNDDLIIEATPSTSIDLGEEVVLSASLLGGTPLSFEWTPTSSLDNPNDSNPIATPTETTTYTVVVTMEGGCELTNSITIDVESESGTPIEAPVDCVDAMELCDTETRYFIPSKGAGEDDFANPSSVISSCFTDEHYSAWFKIKIASSGKLLLNIIPEMIGDDYDFIIFEPTAICGNFGNAARCSYATTTGTNGLRESASDFPEDIDDDGFVAPLEVQEGEEYYLLVDSYEKPEGGFTLEWGGNIDFTCDETCAIEPTLEGIPNSINNCNTSDFLVSITDYQTAPDFVTYLLLVDNNEVIREKIEVTNNNSNPYTFDNITELTPGQYGVLAVNFESTIVSPSLFTEGQEMPKELEVMDCYYQKTKDEDFTLKEEIDETSIYFCDYEELDTLYIPSSIPTGNFIQICNDIVNLDNHKYLLTDYMDIILSDNLLDEYLSVDLFTQAGIYHVYEIKYNQDEVSFLKGESIHDIPLHNSCVGLSIEPLIIVKEEDKCQPNAGNLEPNTAVTLKLCVANEISNHQISISGYNGSVDYETYIVLANNNFIIQEIIPVNPSQEDYSFMSIDTVGHYNIYGINFKVDSLEMTGLFEEGLPFPKNYENECYATIKDIDLIIKEGIEAHNIHFCDTSIGGEELNLNSSIEQVDICHNSLEDFYYLIATDENGVILFYSESSALDSENFQDIETYYIHGVTSNEAIDVPTEGEAIIHDWILEQPCTRLSENYLTIIPLGCLSDAGNPNATPPILPFHICSSETGNYKIDVTDDYDNVDYTTCLIILNEDNTTLYDVMEIQDNFYSLSNIIDVGTYYIYSISYEKNLGLIDSLERGEEYPNFEGYCYKKSLSSFEVTIVESIPSPSHKIYFCDNPIEKEELILTPFTNYVKICRSPFQDLTSSYYLVVTNDTGLILSSVTLAQEELGELSVSEHFQTTGNYRIYGIAANHNLNIPIGESIEDFIANQTCIQEADKSLKVIKPEEDMAPCSLKDVELVCNNNSVTIKGIATGSQSYTVIIEQYIPQEGWTLLRDEIFDSSAFSFDISVDDLDITGDELKLKISTKCDDSSPVENIQIEDNCFFSGTIIGLMNDELIDEQIISFPYDISTQSVNIHELTGIDMEAFQHNLPQLNDSIWSYLRIEWIPESLKSSCASDYREITPSSLIYHNEFSEQYAYIGRDTLNYQIYFEGKPDTLYKSMIVNIEAPKFLVEPSKDIHCREVSINLSNVNAIVNHNTIDIIQAQSNNIGWSYQYQIGGVKEQWLSASDLTVLQAGQEYQIYLRIVKPQTDIPVFHGVNTTNFHNLIQMPDANIPEVEIQKQCIKEDVSLEAIILNPKDEPYSYEWITSDTTTHVTMPYIEMGETSYWVKVTDNRGCETTATIENHLESIDWESEDCTATLALPNMNSLSLLHDGNDISIQEICSRNSEKGTLECQFPIPMSNHSSTLEIVDEFGCKAEVEIEACKPKVAKVTPNPSDGLFNVDLLNIPQNADVSSRIYGSDGRCVKNDFSLEEIQSREADVRTFKVDLRDDYYFHEKLYIIYFTIEVPSKIEFITAKLIIRN